MEDKKSIGVYIAFSLVAVGVLFYNLSSILAPFIFSFVVSYFLNPAINALSRRGVSRAVSSFLIVAMFFTFVCTSVAMIVPFLHSQFSSFIADVPEQLQKIKSIYYIFADRVAAKWPHLQKYFNLESMANESSAKIITSAVSVLNSLIAEVLSSGKSFLTAVSLVFITPLVSFYTLKDWPHIISHVKSFVSPKYEKDITALIGQMSSVLQACIRGQLIVCTFLALLYSVLLKASGLNYAVLIGTTTGFLSIVPYIGPVLGFTWGVVTCVLQYEGYMNLVLVIAIFLIVQFIEGNFITPKVIGNKVDLNPVWIIFGLLACGKLFGFIGLLFAIPITAIIGVLMRFAALKYKANFVA